MASRKQRSFQQMMEDQSLPIIRERLPEEWVVREYKPDYGIDLAVEVFEYTDATQKKAETLGEFFFVQAKSTDKVEVSDVEVHPRYNVEKGALLYDRSKSKEIQVIRYRLDVSELLTVQAMGAGVPVLLFLVELETRSLYYVCLNDLIDKVILPEDPGFGEQESKTILIPVANRIAKDSGDILGPLYLYARRAKFYAAFEKFAYQRHELGYGTSPLLALPPEVPTYAAASQELVAMLKQFLRVALRYDFWTRSDMWTWIRKGHQQLKVWEDLFDGLDEMPDAEHWRRFFVDEQAWKKWDKAALAEVPDDVVVSLGIQEILATWDWLTNLSRVHEEIIRELYLPTYMAHLTDG